MNSLFIVLPILTLLMFDLGLTLSINDFRLIIRRPRPVIIGMIGQIVLLPALAFLIAWLTDLQGVFFIGLILIACCPGGSSSNIFSMLAKGDVPLSVSLTAISSIITLFTIPVILNWAVDMTDISGTTVTLPMGNLLIQNILLMLLPIVLGMAMKKWYPGAACKTEKVLSKCAFPALIFLAAAYFMQHRDTIAQHISMLGFTVTSLLVLAIAGAYLLSRIGQLKHKEQKTIVIEVGMQNAAQAIAIASSPFIFNDSSIAIPAIIYALMMNVVLLVFVAATRYFGTRNTVTTAMVTMCVLNANATEDNNDDTRTDSITGRKEIPIRFTTTVYSDEELSRRKGIDGEQPVTPANIVIGTSRLTLFGYAQTTYSYVHTQKKNSNSFDITRIILMANAELTRNLSFFIMFDAAAGSLHEYYAQYAFNPAFKIRIGQFKQPYTLENIYAPTILDNINFNNSVMYMSGMATDPGIGNHVARDAGLMITGDLMPVDGRPLFNYQLGVFNGTGRNVKENNNQKSVIGMVNYMPSQSLLFSTSFAAGSSRAEQDRYDYKGKPVYAAGQDYHRYRWAASGEIKTSPVYFRTEYMYGNDAHLPMHGCYADLQYHLVPAKFDLCANYDYLNKNAHAGAMETIQTITLGVQYWIYKQCRILSQYIHTWSKSCPVENAWWTQFQIAF